MNHVLGVVTVVGFLFGMVVIALAFSFPGLEPFLFVLGILIITGAFGVPHFILDRADRS